MAVTTVASGTTFNVQGYANAFTVAGGYIYVIYGDSSDHIIVHRYVEATLASEGSVDLGYTGTTDDHSYPTLLIDPTDSKVVVIKSARYATPDVRTCIWKSAHAWGGNATEWAAGDFGASSDVPYPAAGLPSYANAIFTTNGTLCIFCSNRDSYGNGNPTSRGLMLYRYVGDGTGKTAAQLVTGTWSEVIAQSADMPSVPAGSEYYAGTIYPGRPATYGTTGIGILFTLYGAKAGYTSAYDWWGVGYLGCDDITAATPAWTKADDAAWTTGTAITATHRSDATLFIHAGQTGLTHALTYDGTTPHIIYARQTFDGAGYDYANISDADVYHASWSAAWVDEVVDSSIVAHNFPFVNALYVGDYLVATDSDGNAHVKVGSIWSSAATSGTGVSVNKLVAAATTDALYGWVHGSAGTYYVKFELMSLADLAGGVLAIPGTDHIDLTWDFGTGPYIIERRRVV